MHPLDGMESNNLLKERGSMCIIFNDASWRDAFEDTDPYQSFNRA